LTLALGLPVSSGACVGRPTSGRGRAGADHHAAAGSLVSGPSKGDPPMSIVTILIIVLVVLLVLALLGRGRF
jgi:hypothetical protein